jgi:hypothetical protein
MPYSGGNTAGSVLLDDAAYKLKPLPNSNVLYYEMCLIDEGRSAACSFGFGGAKTELGFMCGWTWQSVGYHAAAGSLGCHPQPEHNASYGPRFRAGDIVGAGLDRETGIAFFTCNGRRFRDVRLNDASVFTVAAVSFDTASTTEKVSLNFGQKPFKYTHATWSDPLAALPDDFPYKRVHPKCSWLLTFDSPLEPRRLMAHKGPPGNTNSASTIILVDGEQYKLRPFPGNPNVLYYELQFVNDGGTHSCSFGFGGAKTEATYMCGWTWDSVGYHSNQGNLGCHPHPGHNSNIGPPWRTGDVVGAAIDRERNVIFFTFNGRKLKELSFPDCSVYTAAALAFDTGSTTEKVRLNFGDLPFRYGAPNANPFPDNDPRCSKLIDWPSAFVIQRNSVHPNRASAAALDLDTYKLRPLRNPDGTESSVLYYEVTLLSDGEQHLSSASLGLGTRSSRGERTPGWERGCIGWHGDDGRLYCAGRLGNGTEYGPQWKAGDVLGCGLNRATKTVFFVRNGERLREIDVADIADGLCCALVAFGGDATTERLALNFDGPFRYKHFSSAASVSE